VLNWIVCGAAANFKYIPASFTKIKWDLLSRQLRHRRRRDYTILAIRKQNAQLVTVEKEKSLSATT
jgi:hypothetical protein